MALDQDISVEDLDNYYSFYTAIFDVYQIQGITNAIITKRDVSISVLGNA
jgi:hypothetical protein